MDVLGGARRVAAAAPGSGTLFMARYYFTRPATLVSGDDTEWNQDYQLEAFYEIAPNKVIHFYALWREFRVTTLTSESDFYINLLLGNLVDFDKRTSLVCRDHKVQPKFD